MLCRCFALSFHSSKNYFTVNYRYTQKLDGFLEQVMSRGLIEDGTVAPDISKV